MFFRCLAQRYYDILLSRHCHITVGHGTVTAPFSLPPFSPFDARLMISIAAADYWPSFTPISLRRLSRVIITYAHTLDYYYAAYFSLLIFMLSRRHAAELLSRYAFIY